MALPYIDTPRTEVDANATYLTNGFRSAARHNLSALDSVENSFQSPSKDHDIIKTLENGRKRSEFSLNTPRVGSRLNPARKALHDRRNLPSVPPPKGEFTPMLNSATRNNFLRHGNSTRRRSAHETPAGRYRSNRNTPGLPMDMSRAYDDDSTNLDGDGDPTPVPHITSSSPQSTPLPTLGRNGTVVGDGHNMLTLREQENVINKLEKENFGLKLKVHFLEENFKLANPEFAQVAIQENTELKVMKLSMERDLNKCRKSLRRAEQDLAGCQVELQELQSNAKRRHIGENVQKELELEQMREALENKEHELRDLQEELDQVRGSESEKMQQLRDEIQNLQYDLRRRDEQIENQEDEIENLKENTAVAELEAELQRAREQLDELQDSLQKAKSEAREAKETCEQAVDEKEKAVDDLKELQYEMADKSFYTKGLSRQLEEKATKVEDELTQLRKEHSTLQIEFQAKSGQAAKFQEQIEELKRERDQISSRLHEVDDDIAKDILQTRHDALTKESESLQRDLAYAKSMISKLEEQIEAEKEQSMNALHELQVQHRDEIDRLHDDIESLKHELEDKDGQHAADQDRWDSMKRNLELQKEKVEQQATNYKRTIDKLQDVETSQKLQNLIESEKQRHLQEEELLGRQIKELGDEIASRRQAAESQRQELLNVKEELRVCKREDASLKEKIQALEDEIVVLQASLEEEQAYAKERRTGSPDLEKQLQAANRERQTARDKLANANIEIHTLRTSSAELEAERDELQNRLSAEIDQLQGKLFLASERRDRELISAKSKADRLELRAQELETLLNNQPSPEVGEVSTSPDFSMLQRSLDDSRQKEKESLQREMSLKASIRDLKTLIVDLERENHELKTKELSSRSPHPSPSTSFKVQEELRSLRSQLLDMHKSMKDLRTQNHELHHAAVKEEERKDLHELLKSSTLEAESLTLRLSERDARVKELRNHLGRVREERALCIKREEAAHRELEALQDRYENVLDELGQSSERKGRHAKEIKGLGREIMWLRARLDREQKFRRDLAWSKGLMELGERVRVACNETDLKMIAEMGVEHQTPAKKFNPRRKLKTVAATVLAICRMQKMSAEWRKSRSLEEGLRRAKGEVLRKRESTRRKGRLER
ncbi:hypothetical protein FQN50_004779 [Emmonsiellopsis sp. PD_5]|nr:hypothetical protein FQN50_004779 [Emmonsiellopsis sp. PD_5]